SSLIPHLSSLTFITALSGIDERILCRGRGRPSRGPLARKPAKLVTGDGVLPYHLYGSIPAASRTFHSGLVDPPPVPDRDVQPEPESATCSLAERTRQAVE